MGNLDESVLPAIPSNGIVLDTCSLFVNRVTGCLSIHTGIGHLIDRIPPTRAIQKKIQMLKHIIQKHTIGPIHTSFLEL